MMPGITYWLAASMMVAPCGSITFSPTSAILPSFTRIEPLKVPFETVITVAFLMT